MPGTRSVTKSPWRGSSPKCPSGASATIRRTGRSSRIRPGVMTSSRIGLLLPGQFVDRPDHVEVALVAVAEFSRQYALAARQRLLQRYEGPRGAGHRLGREEGLRQEPFDLSRLPHGGAILLRQLLQPEHRDD